MPRQLRSVDLEDSQGHGRSGWSAAPLAAARVVVGFRSFAGILISRAERLSWFLPARSPRSATSLSPGLLGASPPAAQTSLPTLRAGGRSNASPKPRRWGRPTSAQPAARSCPPPEAAEQEIPGRFSPRPLLAKPCASVRVYRGLFRRRILREHAASQALQRGLVQNWQTPGGTKSNPKQTAAQGAKFKPQTEQAKAGSRVQRGKAQEKTNLLLVPAAAPAAQAETSTEDGATAVSMSPLNCAWLLVLETTRSQAVRNPPSPTPLLPWRKRSATRARDQGPEREPCRSLLRPPDSQRPRSGQTPASFRSQHHASHWNLPSHQISDKLGLSLISPDKLGFGGFTFLLPAPVPLPHAPDLSPRAVKTRNQGEAQRSSHGAHVPPVFPPSLDTQEFLHRYQQPPQHARQPSCPRSRSFLGTLINPGASFHHHPDVPIGRVMPARGSVSTLEPPGTHAGSEQPSTTSGRHQEPLAVSIPPPQQFLERPRRQQRRH